jgi:hypothetical protein
MNSFRNSTTVMAAFLVAIAMTLASCQRGAAQKDTSDSTFLFSLVDVSGTTSSNRASYASGFAKILSQMQGGDTLWADEITESSLATARIPIEAVFVPFSVFTANADDYPAEQNKQKAGLQAQIQQWIASQRTPRTTILDALLVAQKVFHGDKAKTASRRILVIFSDMLEDDGQYCFDSMNLSSSTIRQIVEKERASGRIADLHGVIVYVAGATADPRLDRRRIQQVEAFWRAYFSEAGTELSDERYSASLVNFQLHGFVQ